MRLSQWRTRAPVRDGLGQKVLAVVEPLLVSLGSETDPHCWVAWGDDPGIRYPVFVPTDAGLIVCHVRVNAAGEGPRASGKLVRWSRAQLGELGVETQSGHRIVSFQVEGQVLRGVDDEADAIAGFAIRLFAGADGRPIPLPVEPRRRRPGRAAGSAAKGRAGTGVRRAAAKAAPGAAAAASPAPASARVPGRPASRDVPPAVTSREP